MSDIILAGITLPGDLFWSDEFSATLVGQARKYSLTGALIIQESVAQAGRLITLETTQEGDSWVAPVRLDTLRLLRELEADPDEAPFTLVLPEHNTGTRSFNVAFRRGDGAPIEARPIRFASPAIDTDLFAITLRLIQVD
ncbi:hypothetical protein [Pseudoxanthomonas mexicana]